MDAKTTEEYYQQLQAAAEFVSTKLGTADLAIVLGSGLNGFARLVEDPKELKYSDIPHMPQTSIIGHAGLLIRGRIGQRTVLCLAGRIHAYEGYHMYQLTFTTRLMAMLGVKIFMATNAAGGAVPGMWPGCIMMITDHLNLLRRSIGVDTYEHGKLGNFHVPTNDLYSKRISEFARTVAKRENIKLFEGVYAAVSGPCYETFSEVKYPTLLGVSAFGMSTIPEALTAKALGMEVFAMSLITNLAAGTGINPETLSHSDVTSVAEVSGPALANFLLKFLGEVTLPPPTEIRPLYQITPRIAPLPSPYHRPATKDEVSEAAAFVKSHLNISGERKGHFLGVILSSGHEEFHSSSNASSTVSYKDIPHFPVITSSGIGGSISLASFPHAEVMIFHNHQIEGFGCEEGVFVAELLYELGVYQIFCTFSGGQVSSDADIDSVVYLSDIVDWTSNHPVPSRARRQISNLKPLTLHNLSLAKQLLPSIKEGSYIGYLGPSLPTLAEVNFAQKAGLSLAGITNLAPVYAAASLGIEVTALANVTHSAFTQVEVSNKSNSSLVKVLSGLVEKTRLLSTPKSTLPLTPSSSSSSSSSSSKKSISYQLTQPLIQGEFDEVKQAAEFLKAQIGSGLPTVAVVVDSGLDIHSLPELTITKEIPYNTISGHTNNNQGKFVVATSSSSSSSSVLFLIETQKVNEGKSGVEISFNTRLLYHLDIQKVLILGEVASCSQEIHVGDLITASDHTNLTGRNPLYGHNEARWGPRFVDMSNLFDSSLNSELSLLLPSLKSNLVIGYIIGPIFSSASADIFSENFGAKVLTTGMIPEVIIAKHHGSMKLALVGLVAAPSSRSTTTSEEELSSGVEKLRLSPSESEALEKGRTQLVTLVSAFLRNSLNH